MTTLPEVVATKPPFWRDLRVIKILIQLVAIAITAGIILYLWNNLITNMRAAGISTDFRLLFQPLNVDVAGSNISPDDPIWKGLLVGIRNTFALVIIGIPILTVLGVLIGIGKLSTNWLVAKLCAVYVEIFRNLPPLLIIFFMYFAVILQLPLLDDSWTPLGLAVINRRFMAFPTLVGGDNFATFALALLVALVFAVFIWIWRTRLWNRTGQPHRRVLWSLGWMLLAGTVAYFALSGPISVSVPTLDRSERVPVLVGGISGFSPYWAVLIALSLYTASHVAEITRGSILAVPKGQSEASNALALTGFQRLRYVVLPQAMRVGIPPTISQFLNFTKNTSLALAVGYTEITRIVYQTIGNGHPAPQLIAILMLSYLIFSLTISIIVNILNRRLAFVTR